MVDAAALWRRVTDYAAAQDPLTAASNRLALIVASNQPFYPIYVGWLTGEASPVVALTFVSTPFFLAAPWIAKRFPGVGRLWFPAVGAINTFFCTYLFGEASGVAAFLAPCLVIALLSCRAAEWRSFAVYAAATLGAFMALSGRYGGPLYVADAVQAEALKSLNVSSALILSAIAAWMLSSARRIGAAVTR